MPDTPVTFLDVPRQGAPARFVSNGQASQSSPATMVSTDPQYPGSFRVVTQSGSIYVGQVQANVTQAIPAHGLTQTTSPMPPHPPQQPSYPMQGLGVSPFTPQEERTWGMLVHLAALSGMIGIPFANILGPLICWLMKSDASAFVKDQGKASLNFQISCTIYGAVAAVVGLPLLVLGLVIPLFLPVWGVIAFAVGIFDLVEVIIASIAANNGNLHRYPLSIRFIK